MYNDVPPHPRRHLIGDKLRHLQGIEDPDLTEERLLHPRVLPEALPQTPPHTQSLKGVLPDRLRSLEYFLHFIDSCFVDYVPKTVNCTREFCLHYPRGEA